MFKLIDLTKLQNQRLPDGRVAGMLKREDLFAELSKMGVEGINASMGIHDMLVLLETHSAAQEKAERERERFNPTDEFIRKATGV